MPMFIKASRGQDGCHDIKAAVDQLVGGELAKGLLPYEHGNGGGPLGKLPSSVEGPLWASMFIWGSVWASIIAIGPIFLTIM